MTGKTALRLDATGMSKFFSPEPVDSNANDGRRHAPATARNRDAILAVLQEHLPIGPRVLEIASGSGEHAAFLAPRLKAKSWQPADIEPENIISINAWRTHTAYPQLLPAKKLNILTDDVSGFGTEAFDVVMAANLIHIAPFAVAEALLEKSTTVLKANGQLFLYGPFMRGGEHTSDSNADFDQSLKSRNPEWGIRNLENISTLASAQGYRDPTIVEMPANNLSVFFRKK